MELIELLEQEKVEEFNAARGISTRIDLFAADLSDKNLSGVNLTGANLQKADLSGCNLTDAELTQTDLSGADLTGAILKNVSGMRSRWRDAYLGEADLSDADLAGADLTDADVSDGVMARAMLTGARLKRAILVKTDLSAADLADAYMAEADLKEANLTGAQLREANLSKTDLTQARLGASDLTKAKLQGAHFSGTDLQGACLNSADLTEATFESVQVNGTDFTRADFTDAEIENMDLSVATLTDAQLDGKLSAASGAKSEDAGVSVIHVEDPNLAVNGTRVAASWENVDAQGQPSLRLAQGTLGKPFNKKLTQIPVPADLAVSSSLVAHGDGFKALTLLDRPGGAILNVATVGRGGKITETQSMKLGYAPIVRPEIRVYEGKITLFGISRHGPTIRVDQITEDGLNPVFGKTMPTARGFVAGPQPHVLSKGGVIVPVSPRGMGEPMRVPASFPGRAQVAVPMAEGLALAWIPQAGKGFRFCIAQPGRAPEEQTILPKKEIGTLDMVSDGQDAHVVFTRQGDDPSVPTQAWYVDLPTGTPAPLYEGDEDAYLIKFADSLEGAPPTVGVITYDGSLEMYSLGARGPKHKFHIGGPSASMGSL